MCVHLKCTLNRKEAPEEKLFHCDLAVTLTLTLTQFYNLRVCS